MSVTTSKGRLNLRLEMKSDWHVGTGAGIPGSIDALLARDAGGFPCIPGKTLTGIWRDALETLTFGLDQGSERNKLWQRWVDVIFGSQPNIDKIPDMTPRPAILSIRPVQLDKKLRDAIGDDKQLKQALTFIKPNTAIEPNSGTAKSESLRFTEMGRIGTMLETDFELGFDLLQSVSADQKQLIEALLVASAGFVERIGGNRRRGSGKCEMQVIGSLSKEQAVSVLKGANAELLQSLPKIPTGAIGTELALSMEGEDSDSDVAVPQTSSAQLKNEKSPEVTGPIPIKWKRIEYSLELKTPVAIVTKTLGNVSETLDFIPGTYLLPHITKQLKGISKYLASGDLQVSSATIDVAGKRGRPVPAVILYHKAEGGFSESRTVYNRILEAKEVEDHTHQKKNYRIGYVSDLDQVGTLPSYETTKQVLLMHNTVKDEIQRPHEDVGGVFSRQAIKAGTVLRGVIRFKDSIKDDVKVLEKHSSTVRLGTSKKDDYGLGKLTLGEVEPDTSSAQATTNELIVYFESDVLLRNGNLRQTNLVEHLKVELEKHLQPIKLRSVDDVINEARDRSAS